MKYTYNVTDNKVYCVSRYAGRSFVGVAKCNTTYDTFNIEIGMKLAKLRCDKKIARKKIDRANHRAILAEKELAKAEKHRKNMITYQDEALADFMQIQDALSDMENTLK